MDLEIGRGRPLYERHAHFSPMRGKIIGSNNSLDISKTDTDVHFMHANVDFKKNLVLKSQGNCILETKKFNALKCYYTLCFHQMHVQVHFQKP